jgi:hypothetical protein
VFYTPQSPSNALSVYVPECPYSCTPGIDAASEHVYHMGRFHHMPLLIVLPMILTMQFYNGLDEFTINGIVNLRLRSIMNSRPLK